jgi:Spy/CpxP family protein refolding chaperone
MTTRRVVRRLFHAGLLASLCAALPVAVATAQGGPPVTPAGGQPPEGRRGGREIEAQLQRRIMTIMKERLELSDAQVTQLGEVTRRFERERMEQRGAEYRLRISLRRELTKGDTASQDRVAELLERFPDVERRRIDLMEREQRELAQFLSPVQRARYLALQDEIRRNMEQIRQRRDSQNAGTRDGRPRSGPPRDSSGRGRP